ncbi:hypothetical protein N6H14_14890 [Paenibacillus sp. CC-CFT747]|nr:hypothetical protein N6H14_14890 [Paenibacillus sp. CC-CFT747]
MQHAINQVSQVQLINGVKPETKVACYFDMSEKINGTIIDPDDMDSLGVSIDLDIEDVILHYYRFFIEEDLGNLFKQIKVEGKVYNIIPVVNSVYYGIEHNLLRLIKEKK